MSECKDKLVWPLLSEEEETEHSEVTEKPVSKSFSFAEKVKIWAGMMSRYVWAEDMGSLIK